MARTSFLVRCSATFVVYCALIAATFSERSSSTFELTDTRQAEFVNTLTDYEISVPVKVTPGGDHLTHSLEHRIPADRASRRRRDLSGADSDSSVHYRITVDGRDLHLAMEPNHRLFGPGLVAEHRNAGFRNLSDAVRIRHLARHGDRCQFRGQVRGLPGSQVALSTCNGLHGFIHTGTEQYFVEPVRGAQKIPARTTTTTTSSSSNADVGHPHLVYRRSALPTTPDRGSSNDSRPKHHEETCGVTDTGSEAERQRAADEEARRTPGSKSRRRRTKRSISLERNVETLVVVDKTMMEYYKNEDVETYVLAIMNMVSTMYHDATIGNAINIVLVRIIYLEEDEESLKITHHADNTLASFCRWQMSVNFKDETHPNHHDVAVLLTRHNICTRMNEPCSTLGLSQVSGMCQPHRSCNINEDTGLALAFTVAHEIGHNFGMQHDTPENGCEARPGEEQHVMSPQITVEASPLIWSNCSRRAITIFLDRDWGYCLDDEPSEHPFNFPVLPPGVMYDIDHQCRLQYGPEASYCEGIDNLCTTVWCRVDMKCVTRLEAAAAGTLCGTDDDGTQQWCFDGHCTALGDKPLAIDGQWASWGEWSSCSRSCGAGVSHSERHCNNPQPTHGGRYCLGERKRFKICNTDPCPEGSPSFRELQCAEFNNQPYKGHRYEFEPVSTPNTPCQLHCRPKGRLFSVMLKDMVADGTPCRAGRRDMCISGRCRTIGCDWGIESDAREDQCGVCHGDGTTCTTVKTNFDKETGMGYVEATIIPEGARNIRVEEVAEANNYLAIRNDKGQYYLNGHWYIQWSGDYEAAGTVIHYRRDGNKESFLAPGPIKEPLHVMLLFQSQNPGVVLEYTVPLDNITERRPPEFHWKYSEWTHCTTSCGGGFQHSRVVCVEKEAGKIEVDDSYCNASTKPDDMSKSCNDHLCPARWWTGPWQHCSVSCGDGGIHKRTVLCVRQLGPDQQIALEDWECDEVERPAEIGACKKKEPCPPELGQWKTGPWSDICDEDPCGMQKRPVICSDALGNCDPAQMPEVERRCSNATCGTWTTSDWSSCTRSCDGGVQFRTVTCGGRVCATDEKPATEQPCNKHSCFAVPVSAPAGNSSTVASATTPPAVPSLGNVTATTVGAERERVGDDDARSSVAPRATGSAPVTGTTPGADPITKAPTVYRYMAEFWTKCSRPCGGGIKKRRVRCINLSTKETALDDHCLSQTKPPEEDRCNTGPCHRWTTHPWRPCSTTCGEGIQQRNVTCPFTDHCDPDEKPMDIQLCDAGPCLQWQADPWDKCSKSCGGGVQKRLVRCLNMATKQETSGCDPVEQPQTISNCNVERCPENESSDSAAVSGLPKCPPEGDTMSGEMCRTLLRMGKCRLEYIQRKCCKTCSTAVDKNAGVAKRT